MIRFIPLLSLLVLSSAIADETQHATCEIRGTNGAHNVAINYSAAMTFEECHANARRFSEQPLTDGTRILHPNNTATIKTWSGGFKKIVILYDSVDGQIKTVWKRDPGPTTISKKRVPENFWDCWTKGDCISQ